jgi:hypothetical protein
MFSACCVKITGRFAANLPLSYRCHETLTTAKFVVSFVAKFDASVAGKNFDLFAAPVTAQFAASFEEDFDTNLTAHLLHL